MDAGIWRVDQILLMAICVFLVAQPLQSYEFCSKTTWRRWLASFVLFLAGLSMMFTQAFNPFLYFQF